MGSLVENTKKRNVRSRRTCEKCGNALQKVGNNLIIPPARTQKYHKLRRKPQGNTNTIYEGDEDDGRQRRGSAEHILFLLSKLPQRQALAAVVVDYVLC